MQGKRLEKRPLAAALLRVSPVTAMCFALGGIQLHQLCHHCLFPVILGSCPNSHSQTHSSTDPLTFKNKNQGPTYIYDWWGVLISWGKLEGLAASTEEG